MNAQFYVNKRDLSTKQFQVGLVEEKSSGVITTCITLRRLGDPESEAVKVAFFGVSGKLVMFMLSKNSIEYLGLPVNSRGELFTG